MSGSGQCSIMRPLTKAEALPRQGWHRCRIRWKLFPSPIRDGIVRLHNPIAVAPNFRLGAKEGRCRADGAPAGGGRLGTGWNLSLPGGRWFLPRYRAPGAPVARGVTSGPRSELRGYGAGAGGFWFRSRPAGAGLRAFGRVGSEGDFLLTAWAGQPEVTTAILHLHLKGIAI